MAYFNDRNDMSSGGRHRDSRGGGGRGGFRRDNFRGGDRSDRQMFSAVCSNCGKEAKVPFKPTGEKPVYCSECFEKMGGRSEGRSENRSFDRPRFNDRRPQRDSSGANNNAQLESLNAKLDKIISLLEPKAPKAQSPVAVSEEVKEEKAPKVKKVSKKKALVEKE